MALLGIFKKEVQKQGKEVINEVVSELGGNPQKAEQPPIDVGGTEDFVRRMYSPTNPIDESSIRQVQQQEENTPFDIEVIRAKIAGKEPPKALPTKKQEIARQHQYVMQNYSSETPPKQPKQPEPLKVSYEHKGLNPLEASEPILPGSRGRKAMRNRMQTNILRLKTASAELGRNQGQG